MVLINFHLSSRSFKSTENTLASKSETNIKSTKAATQESEETNMMEEAMETAATLAREELKEAAVHKAQKVKKLKVQVESKIRVQEEAKLRSEIKAREEEKNLAKTNAKIKAHAKVSNAGNSTSEANSTASEGEGDDDKKKKKKKEKEFEEKLDKAVKKRLAALPACKGGDGGDGDGNGTGFIGGTNVFDGKINATDAVGKVGFTNYSIYKAPYKVKRCDQILLLPGKKLNPKDYCEKEDAFMTISIYMMNFFLKKDPNKLVESFNMYEITQIPSAMPGAPGCTMWMTKTRSFPFCYASTEILEQVIDAYYAFMNCRKGPQGPLIAGALLKACDISKLDLTAAGPFGQQGPMYAKMIYAMDPSKQKAKKVNLDDINPYYIYEDKVEVPGSYLTNVKTNLNAFGKKPLGQASNYGPLQGIRA